LSELERLVRRHWGDEGRSFESTPGIPAPQKIQRTPRFTVGSGVHGKQLVPDSLKVRLVQRSVRITAERCAIVRGSAQQDGMETGKSGGANDQGELTGTLSTKSISISPETRKAEWRFPTGSTIPTATPNGNRQSSNRNGTNGTIV